MLAADGMRYVIRLFAGIGLGLYTCILVHYYSLLISRTRNEWGRFFVFLCGLAVFIFIPFFGCIALLFTGPRPSTSNLRYLWFLVVFLSWIGTFWIYAIRNWRTLQKRLGPFEDSDKS